MGNCKFPFHFLETKSILKLFTLKFCPKFLKSGFTLNSVYRGTNYPQLMSPAWLAGGLL